MSQPPDVSFLVPCYNEEANAVGTIETIESCLKGRRLTYEIIVVDDASTDATVARVEAYRAAHPDRLVSLHCNTENHGLGWNYALGAFLAKGRYYMLVHGDNENPPAVISALLDSLGSADMIIPYVENQHERPFIRQVISRTFIALVNLLTGHRLRYYTGSVLHLRENVERFKSKASGFAYQAEILCRALNHGCSFREIPYQAVVRPDRKTSVFYMRNIISVIMSLCRIALWRVQAHTSRLVSAVSRGNQKTGTGKRS